MHNLINADHITSLHDSGLLPATFAQYLTAEYEALEASIHHDDQQPFSLKAHGYHMLVVEPDDASCCLRTLPGNLNLLEASPEYAEIIQLLSEVSVYRACLMLDNECFVLVYALKGALHPIVRQWFAEQICCFDEEVPE